MGRDTEVPSPAVCPSDLPGRAAGCSLPSGRAPSRSAVNPSRQDAWSDQKGQLHLDPQQDYQLLRAQGTPDGLALVFKRPFATCDPKDYLIEVGVGCGRPCLRVGRLSPGSPGPGCHALQRPGQWPSPVGGGRVGGPAPLAAPEPSKKWLFGDTWQHAFYTVLPKNLQGDWTLHLAFLPGPSTPGGSGRGRKPGDSLLWTGAAPFPTGPPFTRALKRWGRHDPNRAQSPGPGGRSQTLCPLRCSKGHSSGEDSPPCPRGQDPWTCGPL